MRVSHPMWPFPATLWLSNGQRLTSWSLFNPPTLLWSFFRTPTGNLSISIMWKRDLFVWMSLERDWYIGPVRWTL